MRNIIILGFGGNCIDILDTINDINAINPKDKFKFLGFLDDNTNNWDKSILGGKVLGPLKSSFEYKNSFFVNGIGSSNNFYLKENIISKTGIELNKFINIIHPSASISKTAQLGYGSVIFQNVIIGSNVKIGNHVIILPNSVISHDVIIQDFTSITSGVNVSGNVVIGKSCYLGSNCSIKENLNIGNYSMIGMGSVVVNNIPSKNVFAGNPSKFLRKIKANI